MRAIPIGRRVRTGLAAGAAATAVLTAAAACTTATATPGTSKSAGQNHEHASRRSHRRRRRARPGRRGGRGVPGHPVRGAPGRRAALAAAAARRALARHPRRPPATPRTARSRRVAVRPGQHVRGLPVPERVHPRRSTSKNLPVMVWVHGGSLRTGESDDYNPAGLVRDGVVVVTINYRLGALGFLADAALASRPGGPSGNYGLMDQQAALRWVQRNIRGFGGNPGDVTLFGESAGGLSTLAQLVSPGARGLFQRAIVESGTYQLTQQPLAAAEAAGRGLRRQGRAAPAPRPAAAPRRPACAAFPSRRSWPTRTRPATPRTSTAPCSPSRSRPRWPRGQFNRVPVVIGTNHDEYRLFVAGYPVPRRAGDRGELPVDDRLHARRVRGHRGRDSRAVPAQPLSQPAGRARRGRHRRDLRLPRAHRRAVAGPVRADLRVRVQRRERAGALPAPGRFPLRRGPRVRAAVPVQPDRRRAPGTASPRPSSSWRRP